ncbi:CAT RNA binding domain-containing protein [Corynebacterium sp. SCR221107]|uniref:CAT RNA binding domain-containing protein n=1 Tax=Corynebacterium sp. SCR221107 TaxID=3017361 RepID=UPI0022EC4D62|nr:CAT RNA binding domain-containing protein [Corynebacterium sp. SCR221107]WBT08997.1 CAT RNA binding domain-containing protein [Corynebacterium sp. SCR221107]
MKVLRVLNDDVVLSTRPDGAEVVLTGWGVGFKMKPGQLVDETKVTQVFVPENSRDVDNMAQLLAAIDPDYLELVGTLLAKHKDAFDEEFGSPTTSKSPSSATASTQISARGRTRSRPRCATSTQRSTALSRRCWARPTRGW